jgi:Zn-dependent protease/predicted transcriptional regulator
MKWSWRILTAAGIGVYVHVTFLLLLVFAGASGYARHHRWIDAWIDIGFVLALFVIVVLHELGHALTARRFGIATRDITLLPIGGVARLERMPEEPRQELLVALAGPAVNVVLAFVFFGLLALGAQWTSWQHMLHEDSFLFRLLAVNVMLAVFNMLPAFPMDGGRVLRALLAMRLDYVRATRIAANVGQGMALLMGLVGVLGFFGGVANPFLVLIAVFIWMGAAQESNMVQMKSALGNTRVDQIMISDFRTLTPEDTLSHAVAFLLAGYQQEFPVVSEGRVVGMLTRTGLVNGLSKLGGNLPVADAMEKEFPTAGPNELAETVFLRLQSSNWRAMPVVSDDALVGMVTSENVAEFLMCRAALRNEPRGRERWEERHAT